MISPLNIKNIKKDKTLRKIPAYTRERKKEKENRARNIINRRNKRQKKKRV